MQQNFCTHVGGEREREFYKVSPSVQGKGLCRQLIMYRGQFLLKMKVRIENKKSKTLAKWEGGEEEEEEVGREAIFR